jgi:hypothetical protein
MLVAASVKAAMNENRRRWTAIDWDVVQNRAIELVLDAQYKANKVPS